MTAHKYNEILAKLEKAKYSTNTETSIISLISAMELLLDAVYDQGEEKECGAV